MPGYTKRSIIAKLFSEKSTKSNFWPVNSCPVVKVSKVMCSPKSNAIFSLHNSFILCLRFNIKNNGKKQDVQKFFHNKCKIKKNIISKTKKRPFNYIDKLKIYLNSFYQGPTIVYYEGFAKNYSR